MIKQAEYVMTRELLDTVIGRTDFTLAKRRRNAARYAEALMAMATQEVDSEVSDRTIQDNIIKIITPVGRTATGIKVTENGFFVSAYHTIDGLEDLFTQNAQRDITLINVGEFIAENAGYRVTDTTGKIYSIDTSFLITDKTHDLALFKAIMPGKVKPLSYNMSNRQVEKNERVVLLGLKSGLYVGEGSILVGNQNGSFESCGKTTIENLFWGMGYVEPGHSGGAIIDQAGSLHGIIKGKMGTESRPAFVGIPSLYVSYLIGKAAQQFEGLAKSNGRSRN